MSVSERDESPEVCFTVRHVLDRVGDKWSTLVIAELGNSTLRFGELRRQVEGISQRMLTVTLRNLERDGLISRRVYPQIPPRVEYSLTDLGQSLLASIVGLVDWSTQHTADIQAARSDFDSRDVAGSIK